MRAFLLVALVLILHLDIFLLHETPFTFSPSFVPFFLLIGFYFLDFTQGKRLDIKSRKFLNNITLLLLPITSSWFIALMKGGNASEYFVLLSYFLLFLVIFSISYYHSVPIARIFFLIAVVNISLGFYGLLTYYNMTVYKYRLVYTSQVNPSWFAASISGSIFGLIFVALNRPSSFIIKLIFGLMGAILLVFLVLTQTLNSILALILGLLAFGFAKVKNPLKLLQSLVVMFIALFLVVYVAKQALELPDIQISKIETIEEGDANSISSGRFGRWKVFLSEPITVFGNGLRFGVESLTNQFYTGGDPHNALIIVYFEMGLFGFLIFAFGFISIFRWLYRNRTEMPLAFGFYVYLLTTCLGNDVIYYKYFWINLSLLSMIVAYHRSPVYARYRLF